MHFIIKYFLLVNKNQERGNPAKHQRKRKRFGENDRCPSGNVPPPHEEVSADHKEIFHNVAA